MTEQELILKKNLWNKAHNQNLTLEEYIEVEINNINTAEKEMRPLKNHKES